MPPTFIGGERSGPLGDLIHDYKYHSVRSAARLLAEIMHHAMPTPSDTPTVIIPLPTISKHIRERGFDHTYLIAKHLAKLRGSSYRTDRLLIRAKDTVQVGSSRDARLAQASRAYAINPKLTINPDVTYILLDDVWTTGASMLAALAELQQAGARYINLAILSVSRID